MRYYFFIIVFFLFSVSAFSQDPQRSKFSAGLSIGYKTPNGLGFIISYHANRVVQVDLMGGYTRYNGGKFGAGAKFYPLKPMKVNPFISAAYSISTGADVKAGNVPQQKERYQTFSNQYVVGGLGITILGEETGHSLQVGYSLVLNNPVVKSYDMGNGYYASRDKVKNSVANGIMATYNLFLFFNKPRRR
jgi:hypothetical protein